MIGLIERIRAALPWAKPAPVDPDSLGAILGAALDARASEALGSVDVACPAAPRRAHPLDLPICEWPIENAAGLALICLAKQFCAEMALRGLDPSAVWDKLADMPMRSLDDLRTADGWATLSAFVSGGAVVLRLDAANPHGDITQLALKFSHSLSERTGFTPGQIYDVLLSLPDSALQLVNRQGTWADLERVVLQGRAPSDAGAH